MNLLVVTVVFPGVSVLIALGVGLILDRVAGRTIRQALILPMGFAGLICLSQVFTSWSTTAPLTPWALLLVGVLGLLFSRERILSLISSVRERPWGGIAFLVAYLAVVAPILLGGRVTLSGYLLETTVFTHMAGAQRIIDFGRSMGALGVDSSYALQLGNYFGSGYPSGSHTLLGGLGGLLPEPLIWLYNPFLSLMIASAVPSLYVIFRRVGFGPRWASLASLVSAIPALVYGFALVGSIKEVTVLPLIWLVGALLVEHRSWAAAGWRSAIPIAVPLAAGVASIGLAFGAWILLSIAILIPVCLRALRSSSLDAKSLAAMTAASGVAFAVAASPTIVDLAATLHLASTVAESNAALAADPGNLLQPIRAVQAAGVWLHGDYRLDPPTHLPLTYTLIGIVLAFALLGIVQLLRVRAFVLLAWLVGLLAVWEILTARGTTWTDAKMVMLSSTVVLVAAWSGVASLVTAHRRAEAAVVSFLLALGVFWSDALLYHDTNRAPTGRFDELLSLDEVIGESATTLVPDFEEGAFSALPRAAVTGPGFPWVPDPSLKTRVDGSPVAYGESVNLDSIPPDSVNRFNTIVTRRSPEAARPPSNYRLIFRGKFYDVWRKSGLPALERLGVVGDGTASAQPSCQQIRRLAERAQAVKGRLKYATRPPTVVIDPRKTRRSSGWAEAPDGLVLGTPGNLKASFRVPEGREWELWLEGNIARPVSVKVDGQPVAEFSYAFGGQGNFMGPARLRLTEGEHRIEIIRGGGGFEPGNGGISVLNRVVFARGSDSAIGELKPSFWQKLCGRADLDWVEVVAPGK